jgi:hypothetical protein
METCPNGHEVGVDSLVCDKCGVAILPAAPNIPIQIVRKRKVKNRAIVIVIAIIVAIIVVPKLLSGGSAGGLSLQSSTCMDYAHATKAQQIAFVESWDSRLVLVGGNNPLQTGLGVMQNYCLLGGGNINSSDQSIGQILIDGALIG